MALHHCASTILPRITACVHRQTFRICQNNGGVDYPCFKMNRTYSSYKKFKMKRMQKQQVFASNDLTDDQMSSGVDPHGENNTPLVLKYLGLDTNQQGNTSKKSSNILRENLESLKLDAESFKITLKSDSRSEDETNLSLEENQIYGKTSVSSKRSRRRRTPKIPCGGCGALLHCDNSSKPGYVPEEQLIGPEAKNADTLLCLRCHVICSRNKVIDVEVDNTVYKEVVRKIKKEYALVVMIVDVTDMSNSIIHNYIEQIGKTRPVFVVGNKVDLIPKDDKDYLGRIQQRLEAECERANLNPRENNIKHVCLISAKTGYGIEELINKMISYWETRGFGGPVYIFLKGDVYLVGTTNSGKSTLFNRFLESDYCKSSCRDIVQRATVSRWPGTTLNLIKFPILRPRSFYLYLRTMRLKEDREKDTKERKEKMEQLKQSRKPRDAMLFATVGKTDFRTDEQVDTEERKYAISGQHFTNYSLDNATDSVSSHTNANQRAMWQARRIIPEDEYPRSTWSYDTPGLINQDQVINQLTTTELRQMLHTSSLIQPRVFVMKPGDTMFITGLARIDYLQGATNTLFTVHTADKLPVHVVNKEAADQFYTENIGTKALGLPLGDEDRLHRLPSLVGRDFYIRTYEPLQAEADLQLSSVGWVSFAGKDKHIHIRAYTPSGRGMHLRSPALLPNILAFKGQRVAHTRRYVTRKPKP